MITSDGGAVMSEQPLMPRPTPEWAGTEDIDDLELDEEGNVKGGTSLALLTWVCRCASMIQIYGNEEGEDKEVVEEIAMCEKDLTSYLMTFTDFTTPEDLVADLDTMLERNSEDAWSMQQFLLRWLEYDFDQVRPSCLFVCVSFIFFLTLVLLFHCFLLLMGEGSGWGLLNLHSLTLKCCLSKCRHSNFSYFFSFSYSSNFAVANTYASRYY